MNQQALDKLENEIETHATNGADYLGKAAVCNNYDHAAAFALKAAAEFTAADALAGLRIALLPLLERGAE